MPTTKPAAAPLHLEINAVGTVDDLLDLRRVLKDSGRFDLREAGRAVRVDEHGRWRQYLRLSVRYQSPSPVYGEQETLV